MGDHGHNKQSRKDGGCCAPFARGGELGPRLTQCGLGRGLLPYQVASSSIQPFVTTNMGKKLGLCPFQGNWAPIQHNVAWAEAYLRTKWHLSPSSRFATMDMGRKLGGCAPLGEGNWVPSNTMSPRLRPISAPSGILIHTAVWPQ